MQELHEWYVNNKYNNITNGFNNNVYKLLHTIIYNNFTDYTNNYDRQQVLRQLRLILLEYKPKVYGILCIKNKVTNIFPYFCELYKNYYDEITNRCNIIELYSMLHDDFLEIYDKMDADEVSLLSLPVIMNILDYHENCKLM